MPRQYSYGPRDDGKLDPGFIIEPATANENVKERDAIWSLVNKLDVICINSVLQSELNSKYFPRVAQNSFFPVFSYSLYDSSVENQNTGKVWPIIARTDFVTYKRGSMLATDLFLISENEKWLYGCGPATMSRVLPMKMHDVKAKTTRFEDFSSPLQDVAARKGFDRWKELFNNNKNNAALCLTFFAIALEQGKYIEIVYPESMVEVIRDLIEELYIFIEPNQRWNITFNTCINSIRPLVSNFAQLKAYKPHNITGFMIGKETLESDLEEETRFYQYLSNQQLSNQCIRIDLRENVWNPEELAEEYTKDLTEKAENNKGAEYLCKFERALNEEFSIKFESKYPDLFGYFPLPRLKKASVGSDSYDSAVEKLSELTKGIVSEQERVQKSLDIVNQRIQECQSKEDELDSLRERINSIQEEERGLIDKIAEINAKKDRLARHQTEYENLLELKKKYDQVPQEEKNDVNRYYEMAPALRQKLQRLFSFSDNLNDSDKEKLEKLMEFKNNLSSEERKQLETLLDFQSDVENKNILNKVHLLGEKLSEDVDESTVEKWLSLFTPETRSRIDKIESLLEKEKYLPGIEERIEAEKENRRLEERLQNELSQQQIDLKNSIETLRKQEQDYQTKQEELRGLLTDFFQRRALINNKLEEIENRLVESVNRLSGYDSSLGNVSQNLESVSQKCQDLEAVQEGIIDYQNKLKTFTEDFNKRINDDVEMFIEGHADKFCEALNINALLDSKINNLDIEDLISRNDVVLGIQSRLDILSTNPQKNDSSGQQPPQLLSNSKDYYVTRVNFADVLAKEFGNIKFSNSPLESEINKKIDTRLIESLDSKVDKTEIKRIEHSVDHLVQANENKKIQGGMLWVSFVLSLITLCAIVGLGFVGLSSISECKTRLADNSEKIGKLESFDKAVPNNIKNEIAKEVAEEKLKNKLKDTFKEFNDKFEDLTKKINNINNPESDGNPTPAAPPESQVPSQADDAKELEQLKERAEKINREANIKIEEAKNTGNTLKNKADEVKNAVFNIVTEVEKVAKALQEESKKAESEAITNESKAPADQKDAATKAAQEAKNIVTNVNNAIKGVDNAVTKAKYSLNDIKNKKSFNLDHRKKLVDAANEATDALKNVCIAVKGKSIAETQYKQSEEIVKKSSEITQDATKAINKAYEAYSKAYEASTNATEASKNATEAIKAAVKAATATDAAKATEVANAENFFKMAKDYLGKANVALEAANNAKNEAITATDALKNAVETLKKAMAETQKKAAEAQQKTAEANTEQTPPPAPNEKESQSTHQQK